MFNFIAAVVVGLAIAAPASAYDPAHLTKLMKTGICDRCDLSSANLRDVDLSGAAKVGTALRGAAL